MPSAQHCGDLFLLSGQRLFWIEGWVRIRKRAEPSLARHCQRSLANRCLARGQIVPDLFVNPGGLQILRYPPRTKAAPQQSATARPGVGFIVNITQFNEVRRNLRQVWPAICLFAIIIVPPAFTYLARQIPFQLGGSGRKAGDIGQRKFL